MKRIAFILLLSLVSIPLFAQNKEEDNFECNFFHCEALDKAVENAHNGIKNLSDRIKERIQEKKETRQARKQKSDPIPQQIPQESEQNRVEQKVAPATGLPLEQVYFSFNEQIFEIADSFVDGDGIIRQVFASPDGSVLILRQYSQSLEVQPEEWPLGEGFSADPNKDIFHDNFFKSTINHGKEITVASSRWPQDERFQDISLVRTVYLDTGITQQYIYRFRIENPAKNSADIFKQALHALELFNPKKLEK